MSLWILHDGERHYMTLTTAFLACKEYAILAKMKQLYANEQINDTDGIKIDFADEWAHLRKSNTEPIIRIYTESKTKEGAAALAKKMMDDMREGLDDSGNE